MLTDGPGRATAWWGDVWAAVGRELAEVGAVCLTWLPGERNVKCDTRYTPPNCPQPKEALPAVSTSTLPY
jgi:hypothetical protein